MRKSKQSLTKSSKNTAQYDLNREGAKISVVSSENVSKYEFLTGKNVLPEKDLLEKTAAIFIIGEIFKSTGWHSKKAVSRIRGYLWVW